METNVCNALPFAFAICRLLFPMLSSGWSVLVRSDFSLFTWRTKATGDVFGLSLLAFTIGCLARGMSPGCQGTIMVCLATDTGPCHHADRHGFSIGQLTAGRCLVLVSRDVSRHCHVAIAGGDAMR